MYKIGDTSLPVERPEMLDDDILKQLHHVLLEVSHGHTCHHFLLSDLADFLLDPHRRGFHDMSKLWTRLSHLEWDPKYGLHLAPSLPNRH